MKLKCMDDVQLAISNIQNIEVISFEDLCAIPAGQSFTFTNQRFIKDDEELYIPYLYVQYDGLKFLSLTSKDEHFDEFYKKVREVYLNEKDKPIPGNILNPYIRIDDYTKKILLSDSIVEKSDLYSFYKDKIGYDNELISREKEVKALLPLISYIISTNLSMLKKHFKSLNKISGYGPRGNYFLEGEINNIYTPITIRINKIGNNSYELSIGNVFGELIPLNVVIKFNNTNLGIECNVPVYNYKLIESYIYGNGKLTSIREVTLDEKKIYSKPIVFDKVSDVPNISKVDISDDKNDDEINKLEWFSLPWGAKMGFNFIENKVDDNTKVSFRKIQYTDVNENVFINLVSAEKRLIRQSIDFRMARDIVFDDVDKTMVGFRDDGITYISTIFGDYGATGEYKSKYAGKCFYHVTSDNFDNLNSNNLYSVGYGCDVYDQGDLLKNKKIKSMVRGN